MSALTILEGPLVIADSHPASRTMEGMGWRHYQFISHAKVSNCTGDPSRVREVASKVAAEFHAAGTWEDFSAPAAPGSFPTPRAEFLERIRPLKQEEFA